MIPKPVERRTSKPVLVALTASDRKRLERASKKYKTPMATLAYQCVKHWLDSEYGEGGAA
jgi:hypothetical protein